MYQIIYYNKIIHYAIVLEYKYLLSPFIQWSLFTAKCNNLVYIFMII